MRSLRSLRALAMTAVLAVLASCAPVRRPSSVESREPPPASAVFYVPVRNPHVLSRFGPRGRRYHTGIDIRGKRGGGDFAYAARAGKVERVTRLGGYGKIVIIRHADGYTTRYAHLAAFKVKVGQKVKGLTPVGVIGRTGRATTEHLHFEIVTPGGKFINPEYFLPSLKD